MVTRQETKTHFKMNLKRNLVLCLFGLVACTPEKSPVNNPAYDAAVEQRIERIINNLQVETSVNDVFEAKTLAGQMKKYATPGLSIAVINDGKIEWARGFGVRNEKNEPVDVETLFEAGSVSKPTFALTVMKLKEKGVVDLDQDVNAYLKSWKVPANGDWQPRLTLRQLLSHTAGLTVHGFPGYKKSEAIPTVPQVLSGEAPANTGPVKVNLLPGTRQRYSGGGTTVAQQTIMDVVGKPFPALVREELFGPLKLKHSTYQQPLPDSLESIASTAYPWKGEPIEGRFHTYPEMAAAGLWTNPSELATLLVEVQKAVKGESNFFKKETIDEMLTPQKVADFIGIGFFLESKGDSARFGHGGWDEGFVTEAVAYKHLGKGAVIMVNSNEGQEIQNEILRAIAIEYGWPDYIPAPKKESTPIDDELKSIPGTYKSDVLEMTIVNTNGGLTLLFQQQPPLPLKKIEDGSFRNLTLNFKLTFDKDVMKFEQQGRTVEMRRVER